MELQVKVYNHLWVFKQQINPKNIYSDIIYQEEANWWQWDLRLTIGWLLSNYAVSDIIEVKDSINWAVYTWIIESIWVVEYESWTTLDLNILGVFTALNDVYFKSGGLRKFTLTWTPWNLIKQVIDSFNAEYWTLADTQILLTNLIRYTWNSIDITWTSLNIDFNNDTCISAINKIIKNTDFKYFIWVDGIVNVIQKINSVSKVLTFERQIINITRDIDKRNLVNKYYLTWWTWITEVIYQDNASQTSLWLKEKVFSDSTILDIATQNVKWNAYILENKQEENIVVIRIKPNSIALNVLDKITTLNSRNNLINKEITKLTFRKEYTEIYLWYFVSFWRRIVKGK